MTDPMLADERVAAAQAAVRATAVGGPDWARAVDDLAEEWLRAGDIDRAIAARRMGLARLTDDARPFALACWTISVST